MFTLFSPLKISFGGGAKDLLCYERIRFFFFFNFLVAFLTELSARHKTDFDAKWNIVRDPMDKIMSIDLKFVELTADVLEIFIYKIPWYY